MKYYSEIIVIFYNYCFAASNSPCSTPPKIPYGYNKYSSSLHGSKAYYQCFNGFELSKGDGELRCVDGEWVGAIPICSKVNCAYPGALENGKIYYVGNYHRL